MYFNYHATLNLHNKLSKLVMHCMYTFIQIILDIQDSKVITLDISKYIEQLGSFEIFFFL